MTLQVVEGLTRCCGALIGEEERERMPERVEKMAPFLKRYPNRGVARLLQLGFLEGFIIPCQLRAAPPMAANLWSSLLHPEVISEKLFKEMYKTSVKISTLAKYKMKTLKVIISS